MAWELSRRAALSRINTPCLEYAAGPRRALVDSPVGIGGDVGTNAHDQTERAAADCLPRVTTCEKVPPLFELGRPSVTNMTHAPTIA